MNQDPSRDHIIRELLEPHKTVRDSIHGDIYLNRLEVELMDTQDFQRLHSHKQLGLANRIFPAADHSRFQHSLGTLFVAGKILEAVNRNAERFSDPPAMSVEPYGILLTRTGALLHDFVNIPFGHTLEDEGLLVEEDWKDHDRVRYFFDSQDDERSPIAKTRKLLDERGLDGAAFVKDLEQLLTFKDGEQQDFAHAYAADIIGNTFCADLSDYLERDLAFTGLNAQYRNDRSRVIQYLFIPKEGDFKGRLVVRVWHKRFKDDVVSELIFTLTLRYFLAERVYFHHTKNVLGAMLIGAVQRSGIIESNKRLLYQMGDDDLLNWLKQAKDPSPSLIEAIRNRSLFDIVFQSSNLTDEPGKPSMIQEVKLLRNREKGAKYRLELERHFAKILNSDEVVDGDVLIYCPDHHGNLKVAETRLLWSVKGSRYSWKQLKELKDLREPIAGKIGEQIKTLERQHEGLWSLLVLVKESVGRERREELAAYCRDYFGVENEAEEYTEFRDAMSIRLNKWVNERNILPKEAEKVRSALEIRRRTGSYRKVVLPTFKELDALYRERGGTRTIESF